MEDKSVFELLGLPYDGLLYRQAERLLAELCNRLETRMGLHFP